MLPYVICSQAFFTTACKLELFCTSFSTVKLVYSLCLHVLHVYMNPTGRKLELSYKYLCFLMYEYTNILQYLAFRCKDLFWIIHQVLKNIHLTTVYFVNVFIGKTLKICIPANQLSQCWSPHYWWGLPVELLKFWKVVFMAVFLEV